MRKSNKQIDEEEVKEIRKTQKLLKHFGLTAYAFNPGVRCFVEGDGVKYVGFDDPTWEFVEGILRELIKYRNKYGTNTSKRKESTKARNVS